MKSIRIGLLGFGTVGAGVVEGIMRNGDLIAQRTGLRLEIGRIADLDWESDRGVEVDSTVQTTDAFSVVDDPTMDVIVELIGGTGIARELVLAALKAGKPVVTANKALLAKHGAELFQAAEQQQVDLGFEASTGGCIPIIRSIREALAANRFTEVYGILNGTCNYILTRMESEHAAFDDVLREAQDLGYAEAEPSLDIDGHDTAHKATLLASLLGGAPVDLETLPVQGIRGMQALDIVMAHALGHRIKLLAHITCSATSVQACVEPALIPLDSMLAQVSDAFNAVMVKTDMAGDTFYYGRGAGRKPTASAVIADIIDIGRNGLCRCSRRVPPGIDGSRPLVRIEQDPANTTPFYVRVSHDNNEALRAELNAGMAAAGITIKALKSDADKFKASVQVTAMITTPAPAATIRSAIKRIASLPGVQSTPVVMSVKEGL